MEHDEDIQIEGSMSDYLIQKMNEEHNNEFTVEYLKADFLTSAANALFTLRHNAGLTQAQVAEQLHTKQSAVARLEADFDGAISLRRYVDFALACGVIPHHFTFVPIGVGRNFTMTQPETPLTFENQRGNATFRLTLDTDGVETHGTFVVSSSATTLQGAESRLSVVESQSQATQIRERAA